MVGWGRFLLCWWTGGAVDVTCAGVELFRPCFSYKFPAIHWERCCVLVVVQTFSSSVKLRQLLRLSLCTLFSFYFSFLFGPGGFFIVNL